MTPAFGTFAFAFQKWSRFFFSQTDHASRKQQQIRAHANQITSARWCVLGPSDAKPRVVPPGVIRAPQRRRAWTPSKQSGGGSRRMSPVRGLLAM